MRFRPFGYHCAKGTTSLGEAVIIGEANIIYPEGQTSFIIYPNKRGEVLIIKSVPHLLILFDVKDKPVSDRLIPFYSISVRFLSTYRCTPSGRERRFPLEILLAQ